MMNIATIETTILVTKKEFNIGSPKQLGEILFEEMGLQGGKKTKTGIFSTNVNILEELAFNGEEIAKYILSWRELSKLRSTYSEALVDQISKTTKKNAPKKHPRINPKNHSKIIQNQSKK